MINPHLDFNHWRQVFARHGRAQISSVLDEVSAKQLHGCPRYDVSWTLAYREKGKSQVFDHEPYQKQSEEERAQRLQQLQQETRGAI